MEKNTTRIADIIPENGKEMRGLRDRVRDKAKMKKLKKLKKTKKKIQDLKIKINVKVE